MHELDQAKRLLFLMQDKRIGDKSEEEKKHKKAIF